MSSLFSSSSYNGIVISAMILECHWRIATRLILRLSLVMFRPFHFGFIDLGLGFKHMKDGLLVIDHSPSSNNHLCSGWMLCGLAIR